MPRLFRLAEYRIFLSTGILRTVVSYSFLFLFFYARERIIVYRFGKCSAQKSSEFRRNIILCDIYYYSMYKGATRGSSSHYVMHVYTLHTTPTHAVVISYSRLYTPLCLGLSSRDIYIPNKLLTLSLLC